jgi:hypothetical protein
MDHSGQLDHKYHLIADDEESESDDEYSSFDSDKTEAIDDIFDKLSSGALKRKDVTSYFR